MGKVTRQSVFAAAERLAAKGERPSQRAIRAELDGGSFTEIGLYLRDWKVARRDRQAAESLEMPEVVGDLVRELVQRVWTVASEAAAVGLDAARRDVAAIRADLGQETADALDVIGALELERNEMVARVDDLQSRATGHAAEIRMEVERRAAAEAAVVAAEIVSRRLADDLEARNGRAAALEEAFAKTRRELGTTRDQLVATVAERDAAWTRIAELDAERTNFDARMVRLEARISAAEARASGAEDRADRLRGEVEDRSADLAALRDLHFSMTARHEAAARQSEVQIAELKARSSGKPMQIK